MQIYVFFKFHEHFMTKTPNYQVKFALRERFTIECIKNNNNCFYCPIPVWEIYRMFAFINKSSTLKSENL